ncbi:MAG: Gfo/Idh/MocA family oxidoreductase [Thermoguttaceae bacterium]|jgi:predicted dehydrogenase|nr:Gfo/Idh/MocA family oxidoreductase [Thermoguttaceae bacterium]
MTTDNHAASPRDVSSLPRRGFLAGAGAIGLSILKPELVFGSQANTKVKIGLVGCGGRGTWIAKLFQDHGGYQLVAAADYFKDRVDRAGEQFKIEAARRYTGLDGYKRLLDSKPDAIVIESPPYFHPEQAMAGVDAGCHVYCAKPIAVDVPGCLTIAEAGRKGTEKKRCVLIDFQTRTSEFYQEAIRRVHAGDIGPLVNGEAVYYCGPTWGGDEVLAADPKNPENRLRAWGLDRVLSGDVITEQNIHTLDVATWIVNADPLRAYGVCAKKGRQDHGDCHDHFSVIFEFPGDVTVAFISKQYGTGYDDIGNRMFGPKGMIEAHYFGATFIRGEKSYKGGKHGNLYTDGAIKNIADFHASILKGDFSNPTVAPSVRSNLTTILGRTAAYKRASVTWDEMMKTAEKWEFAAK